ncbi:MAG: MgtC/SapB family protein [Parcubacteria group bacterium]|nr:MgtC/SapB family protein [Parcubacteria group bacterium]
MIEILDPGMQDTFFRLSTAAFLGLILGTERVLAHKQAGMRTYALISLGAALFVIVSEAILHQYASGASADPIRMAAAVVTGIGFIGAGLIIFKDKTIRGLTTAAGLWVTAGIGIASGFGLYAIAVFSTILAFLIFTLVWFLEYGVKKWSGKWDEEM